MRQSLRIAGVILAIAVVGCASAAPSTSPSPSSGLPPSPRGTVIDLTPTFGPTLRPVPTPAETATPVPTEAVAPVETRPPLLPTPAGWTDPVTVISGICSSLDAQVDGNGGYHVVATCGDGLVYAFSTDRKTWSTTTIAPPAGRTIFGAKLAIDENVVDLAYGVFNPNQGCVGGPPDGVYYRTRTLPAGSWSEPSLLGNAGDTMQQFGASGGILRAIVSGTDYVQYYERLTKGVLERFPMDYLGGVVMAVGNDGRGRIVGVGQIGGPENLSLVMVTTGASGLSAATAVGGTTSLDSNPIIALDGADKVHLLWTHNAFHGCGDYQATPEDGTYHGTNASGSWVSERITTDRGSASLAVEPTSGRLHAIVSVDGTGGNDAPPGVGYYTRTASGPWTSRVLLPIGSLIRFDGATGGVLVVDIDYRYQTGVSVMLKPGQP